MQHTNDQPIFYDPRGIRWKRLRWGSIVVVVFTTFMAAILIASILINPVLDLLHLQSSSLLPQKKHLTRSVVENTGQFGKKYLDARNKLFHQIKNEAQKTTIAARVNPQQERVAFFVNWDDASFSSLKQHITDIDVLIPEWLHLKNDGSIVEDNKNRQEYVLQYIRSRKPDQKIYALINNYNGTSWDQKALVTILSSNDQRKNSIDTIINYVKENKLQGISIDFENIPQSLQKQYVGFLGDLTNQAHQDGLVTTVNVPFADDSFQYSTISKIVDCVIVMGYDEHWSTGSIGPIASIDWFEAQLLKRMKDVPKEKLIIALGNYAYDWPAKGEAQVKTFEEGILTARESESEIILDPNSLNPYFDYEDESGVAHRVWMLDGVTFFNQLNAITDAQPRGIALWRLGSEDPSLWGVISKTITPSESTISSLRSIRYDYNLDYEGQGEIIKVSSDPQEGKRTITYDKNNNFIIDEHFETLPSPYVITRYGASSKKIALTFDDGPDPQTTAKILDILKEKKVPATFFVIGSEVEKNPALVAREYREGNDIGNHTFTHPNISDISMKWLNMEVAATSRIIESVTGHNSYLFRPPFAEDSEPETPDEVKPIEEINNLGYVTVGMQIDPKDWENPGVQNIVDTAMSQVHVGKGNVVLLHDGGGDRQQTLAALPLLIDKLKSEGYELVTVGTLLQKSRDEIMPSITPNEKWLIQTDRISFFAIRTLEYLVGVLFFFTIIFGVVRLIFIIIFAIVHKKRNREPEQTFIGSVAVIVPAFNEEKVIVKTIDSLLHTDYGKPFEIIIVDDGSTDHTVEVVEKHFGLMGNIRLLKIKNGGKSRALMEGVKQTNADVIIAMDADTIFTKETIRKLVNHFTDQKVGAVAGNAKVGNRINILTRLQSIEYITSQNLDRRAFAQWNSIMVVPGAVGAWRRSFMMEVGGFMTDTLAEDADLTLRVRRAGHKILYEDEAIGLTEAPDTIKGFLKQRYRWIYGTFQTSWKHKDLLMNKKYGVLGYIVMPAVFIQQIIIPVIAPIIDVVFLWVIIGLLISYYFHPREIALLNGEKILFYYSIFMMTDLLSALIAFMLEKNEKKIELFWILWQRIFFRQLFYYVAWKSLVTSIKGFHVGWQKIDRKATVRSGKV